MNTLNALRLGAGFLFPVLLVCGIGCSSKATQPGGNGQTPPDLAFNRDPAAAPVISSGSEGWPIFPTDPGVIADSEGYHLFYTSYFCKASGAYYYSWDVGNLAACNITDGVATVGYAFSSDGGYTWQFRGRPVVMPGPEPWQCGDLETPHAAVLGDTLYLFYSATGTFEGEPFPQRYQIGAATLDLNGGTIRQRLLTEDADFTRRPEPLLPYNTTATAFDNNTQEPSVVIRDGLLELFYIGVRFAEPQLPAEDPGQTLLGYGLAKAVFTSDLTLTEAASGYLLPNANITEVKYFDSTYYVFSTTGTDGEFHRHERIELYRSSDGTTFSAPVDLLLPQTSFDSWGLMAPTVIVNDSQVVMFYTGWNSLNHPCFPEPLPPDTRFGRPSDDGATCIHGSIGRTVAVRPDIR
ncbi:MAG TPA: hypothetical protein VM118_02020 [Acidobacteriota bacterium]|nr:hypothetical protein [Acidobacteriota bacterium]